MQDRINILNELRDAEAFVLLNADNKNYYHFPEGYFNNLSGDILSNIFISSLPALNPYSVPEKYFENFSELIIEKINSPVNTKENPYMVPLGYFVTLSENILSKVRSSDVQLELEEISPFLSSISKANVYSVPDNFFQQTNPAYVVNNDKQPAKVVSMGNRVGNWLKYAVAACVAALLFGGGYLYFSGSRAKTTQVSSIASMDVQKEISGLSDDEINNYLKDNNNIAVFTTVEPGDSQLQNPDIQNMLQNVSDDEIQQYLKDDPESKGTGGGI